MTESSLHPDASRFGAATGEALPAHSAPTYYDRPLLKKPGWHWEVITYLFLGGVMGGSGMLVAIAHPSDRELKRNARYASFVLAASCPAILISHLGRPERFLHMLRVVKLKSVMSMGVWGLIAFSLPATAGAAAQAADDGLLPPRLRSVRYLNRFGILDTLSAALGAFIAGYTGVLISATAIPFWAIGKRYIPALCVCSGMAGACALQAALNAFGSSERRTLQKLERLELVAGIGELVLFAGFARHAGDLGRPMFRGERGRKLQLATMLGGIVVPNILTLLPSHARWKTILASAATLYGGYVFRESLIEAGKDSADDPRAAARQPQ